jgi:hypothetical protein
MLWPRLRDRIGWVVLGVVFVAGIWCQLAISSGQSLRHYVPETQLVRAHVHMGGSIRPWVLLMFLALLGVMLVARRAAADPGGRRDDQPSDERGGRGDDTEPALLGRCRRHDRPHRPLGVEGREGTNAGQDRPRHSRGPRRRGRAVA